MTLIGDFFEELDAVWTSAASSTEKIQLRLIGSTALMLQTSYARGTKDSDILETSNLTGDVKRRLLEYAGNPSKLQMKYKVYVELVPNGLPFLPQAARYHPVAELNERLQSLHVEVLDVVDVVVSKLVRFHANDRADIAAMVEQGLVPHAQLLERFRSAVDVFAFDARGDRLPKVVSHLHVVERDFLDAPETPIELRVAGLLEAPDAVPVCEPSDAAGVRGSPPRCHARQGGRRGPVEIELGGFTLDLWG